MEGLTVRENLYPISTSSLGRSGSVLAGGMDGKVRFWNDSDPKQVKSTMLAGIEQVTSICPTYQDFTAVTGSKDGVVKLWDLQAGCMEVSSGSIPCQIGPVYGIGVSEGSYSSRITWGVYNNLLMWDFSSNNVCEIGDVDYGSRI